MNVFEHSFTLIALVLGLALTHVLSEFAQFVRLRGLRALGVLTPMLAVFVILDIATFWGILWEMRLSFKSVWPVLGFGVGLSSLYYIAACYIFPIGRKGPKDLDLYYMQNRRLILGIMLFCYLFVIAHTYLESGHFTQDPVSRAYLIILTLTIIVPWRSVNAIGLVSLIIVDTIAFIPIA